MSIHTLIDEWSKIGPAAWAQDNYGWLIGGKPIQLSNWQLAVLGEYEQRREDVSTLFVSTVKKAGKTSLTAIMLAYRWLTVPGLHYTLANDKAQSEELQFLMITEMVKAHPVLKRYTRINRDTLLFEPTGSRLVSLPLDAPGSAGANFATVSFSELWGYVFEQGNRLFEELTPIPLTDCVRLIDSYAGYTAESELLQRVWDRGEAGQRVNEEWPIYLAGQQLSYIHQGQDAQIKCWRGTEAQRQSYYEEQRASLRPMAFKRLHLNEWSAGAESFLEAQQVEAITNPDLGPLLPGNGSTYSGVIAIDLNDTESTARLMEAQSSGISPIYCGLDLSTKQDHSALSGVYFDAHDRKIKLAWHYVWTPPIEIGAIEARILGLASLYNIAQISYDPFQAAYLAQRLQVENVPMAEFVQTPGNLKSATEAFYSLINSKRLEVYPSEEVMKYLLNAKTKELPDGSGYRLVKGSQSKKIDLAVTMAWASYFCNLYHGGN